MKVMLDDILQEYGKNLDAATRAKILEKQKRTLRRELQRMGKVRSNFRSKKQFTALKKLAQAQLNMKGKA